MSRHPMSMDRVISRLGSLTLLAGALACPAGAQTPDLPLQLPDGRVVTFSAARLDGMATDTITAASHGATPHTYRVLRIHDLLIAAGVRVDSVRGPRTTWVLVATASDGFRTSFSLGEIAEYLGPTRLLLATGTSTGPLPPEEGPYRLLVPTDKRSSRAARLVTSLSVVDARPPR